MLIWMILFCWYAMVQVGVSQRSVHFFLHPAASHSILYPEMNPIEQIWMQPSAMGFRNEVFHTLKDVVDRLYICQLTQDMIHRFTARDWIVDCFLEYE